MTGIFRICLLRILACETQNFASLLWFDRESQNIFTVDNNDGVSPVETQNLASPVQKAR